MTKKYRNKAIARFMKKWRIDPVSSCWLWSASVGKNGYGHFGIENKIFDSHRAAWLLLKGPIPRGKLVCHTCDNTLCVNPNHLWLGTNRENVIDARRKGVKFGPQKLEAEQVREIRKTYKKGNISTYQLADDYNVSQTTIWKIINLKRWKWLS